LVSSHSSAEQAQRNTRISSLKAVLFFEDKGTFSEDVSEVDIGPPYVPPKLWNTTMHYEDRSTSVFVTVEVIGEPSSRAPKLEFIARYVPWQKERGEIVVRKVVRINLPMKARVAGEDHDKFYAGFWLYETGCNPVRLSARIVGQRLSTVKKVIKFGCGE
jgi:hypothetical protein